MLGLRIGARCCSAERDKGFTLIELMIVVAVLGILAALGTPSFRVWIQNAKIRSAAESISSGLQMARSEAVRRNAPVFFQLKPMDDATLLWKIGCVTEVGDAALPSYCPALIQSRVLSEGGGDATLTVVSDGGNMIVFDSFGRKRTAATIPANVDDFSEVNVDSTTLSAADSRPQRIVSGAGGTVRACDVKLTVTSPSDPRACP